MLKKITILAGVISFLLLFPTVTSINPTTLDTFYKLSETSKITQSHLLLNDSIIFDVNCNISINFSEGYPGIVSISYENVHLLCVTWCQGKTRLTIQNKTIECPNNSRIFLFGLTMSNSTVRIYPPPEEIKGHALFVFGWGY